MRDMLFKEKDFVFSYRVAGVLIRDGKILLQKPENDGYSLIGGHVGLMETTAETLVREFAEEIHADIEVGRLMAVGEVFFLWGKRPCHQISLYYRVNLADEMQIPLDGVFHGYDDLGNERINLDFCWVPLERLGNGLAVYPQELIPYILDEREETVHFVSRQIGIK